MKRIDCFSRPNSELSGCGKLVIIIGKRAQYSGLEGEAVTRGMKRFGKQLIKSRSKSCSTFTHQSCTSSSRAQVAM